MNCKYCEREINNAGSLKAHENTCKNNPERVRQTRSLGAGAQKGCIPWNKGKKVGPSPIWGEKFPTEKMMVENSSTDRGTVRRRILKDNLIQYICAICGLGPEWLGKPMPLLLDHINGINNDHRLGNLRFICSNCDTQLDTYKSRNRGRTTQLEMGPRLKRDEV